MGIDEFLRNVHGLIEGRNSAGSSLAPLLRTLRAPVC